MRWRSSCSPGRRPAATPWGAWLSLCRAEEVGDDRGGRHAALVTYYGFLSIFPILLVAASVVSTALMNKQALREEMVEALLPPALQERVNTALAAIPHPACPWPSASWDLLLSATGVVFSAYETLNHLAGVPLRSRFGWFSRYAGSCSCWSSFLPAARAPRR